MSPNAEPSSASPTALASISETQEASSQPKEMLVSTELLNALLAKVDRLDHTLQKVQTELATLRQNCGGAFTLFPKLPPELRRRIWTFAYRAPQLHVIHWYGASRSQINSVFNSCSEARGVGLSLKLDYFLCCNRQHYPDGTHAISTIKNYVNLDEDTVWLSDTGSFHGLPGHIQWVCGKCHVYEKKSTCDRYQGCGKGCLSNESCEDPWKIRRLAINYPDWAKTNYFPDQPEGSLRGIWYLNVEELLFVVGEFEQYTRTRDITFATPSQSPVRVKNNTSSYNNEKPSARKTWPEFEKEVEGYMKDFKAQRATAREECRIEFEEDEEFTGNFEDVWLDGLEDLSDWEIPRVRFVEVRNTSRDWVFPPKENIQRY